MLRKSLHFLVEVEDAFGPEASDEHAVLRQRVLRCRINAVHDSLLSTAHLTRLVVMRLTWGRPVESGTPMPGRLNGECHFGVPRRIRECGHRP